MSNRNTRGDSTRVFNPDDIIVRERQTRNATASGNAAGNRNSRTSQNMRTAQRANGTGTLTPKQAKKQEKLELKEEARQKRAAKRREWKKRTKEVFCGWKESIREKLPKKKQEPPEILENTKTSTAADPMGDTETFEQTEQTDAVEMTVTEEEQTEKSVDTEGSGTTSMEEA